MAVQVQETETDLIIESDPTTGGQYNGTRIRLSQDMTRLKEKDYKLLKKENTIVLGESGGPYAPTFGNHINDYVKFHVYNMNDEYIKSGISENFENSDGDIKLDPGTDLRKAGFTRGNYKIKYYFYRRMAGSDEVVLTKNVGNDSGIVHSGNPQLTDEPMGAFYVDEDGKVYEGEGPPVDGSPPSELDVKEYKFFIDDISSDRKEVRLAPQLINLNKYKQEFNSLSNMYEVYVPLSDGGYGSGKFNGVNSTAFNFDTKLESDIGFEQKYKNGFLEVENAFTVGYEDITNTEENEAWSLEDPIPESYIEAYDLKDAGFPMAVRYVVKEESNQKTLGGHNFEGYTPIPNLTTPGIRYHFDFGCGHTEITDTPFANHTYDTVGSYTPTVTIMTPNFTDVITDVYSNTNAPLDGPGLRGSKLKSFIPTPEEDSPPSPPPTPSTSPFDGRMIRHSNNAVYYIQSGHKRFIDSMAIAWQLATITGQYVAELTVYNAATDENETTAEYIDWGYELDDSTINAIPGGPDLEITGDFGITDPNTLTYSIIDGQFAAGPNYIPPEYTIIVAAGTGGTATGGTTATRDSIIDISATADTSGGPGDVGYEFLNWTDSSGESEILDTNSPSTSVVVKADSTITANFQSLYVPPSYNIEVAQNIEGGSTTGGGTYVVGTVITITAIPHVNNEGYQTHNFVEWISDGITLTTPEAETTTLTVTENASIQAIFTPAVQHTITVNNGQYGEASGGTAYDGGSVTLYAYPSSGYRVNNWSGTNLPASPSSVNGGGTHRTLNNVTDSFSVNVTFTLDWSGDDDDFCFIAGTQITMSDGSMKNIEDIEVGDIVKSWNEEISQIENGTVIKLMSPIHDDIVKLTFGDVVNGNTFDHPYYVKGKGWCSYKPEWTMERYDIGQIGQLEVGDVCYYNNDSELEEIKLSHIKEELGEVQTYIFKVENNTFFANNILTHNK